MPRRQLCPLCGKAFSTVDAVVDHIRKEHSGKLSKRSVEYLISLGIGMDKIAEYCKKEGIKLGD